MKTKGFKAGYYWVYWPEMNGEYEIPCVEWQFVQSRGNIFFSDKSDNIPGNWIFKNEDDANKFYKKIIKLRIDNATDQLICLANYLGELKETLLSNVKE